MKARRDYHWHSFQEVMLEAIATGHKNVSDRLEPYLISTANAGELFPDDPEAVSRLENYRAERLRISNSYRVWPLCVRFVNEAGKQNGNGEIISWNKNCANWP